MCVPARDDETTGTCAAIPVYADLTRIVPGEELDSLARGLGPCPRGTLPDADGRCVDLDECAFFLDACQVSPRACRNLPPQEGRYECVCPQGCSGTGEADNPCRGCSDESCRAEDAEVAR